MKEYDILAAVDVVIAYHKDIVKQIASGVPVEDYKELMAESRAARNILRNFADVMDEYDKATYLERLQTRLDALSELVFFRQ